MFTFLSALYTLLCCRLRSLAELALEVIALRHQLGVLRRQRPERPVLRTADRLLWVWLYRLGPRGLDLIVLVKPATVIQWHRQGFRLYWRRRCRAGRKSMDSDTRKLIRERSIANPLWGAPRIHGELLKLGIEFSQATVARHVVRKPCASSPSWRSLLRNQIEGVAVAERLCRACDWLHPS